ncbi:MAG: CRTAC1 family protein [Alphaproteobacteria bacterium]|nr:CRTAC1 family protein [Alphaproteobacteria bacterium]
MLFVAGLFFSCAATDPSPGGGRDSSEDTGERAPVTDPALVLDEVQACEAPLAAPAWQVVVAPDDGGSSKPDGTHEVGGSLAVGDFDADGIEDIVVAFMDRTVPLRWEEGRLVAGGAIVRQYYGCLTIGDLGDGPAVFEAGITPARLWVEEGRLVEERLRLPWPWDETASDDEKELPAFQTMRTADVDGDGAAEIFGVIFRKEDWSDRLFTPDGTGGYTETVLDPALGLRKGFDVAWLDADGDGDLDAWVSNDQGHLYGGDALWTNDGGVLVDGTAACGDCTPAHDGMGVASEDIDGDGVRDVFLAATAGTKLLLGDGSGGFVDVTLARAATPVIEPHQMAWGSDAADLDNDGRRDLVIGLGDQWPLSSTDEWFVEDMPLSLLFQQEDGSFVERGPELGLDLMGSWRSVVPRDLNGDGVLDVVLGDVRAPVRVLASTGCTEASWLEVEAPVGSRVEVEHAGGTAFGWARYEHGYGGSALPRVHVGLGGSDTVEALRVVLPGGRVLRWEEPFEARRRVRVALSEAG